MERQFHFVDATTGDRQAKRLARSHVMKGKNAGRKIHRRSRLEAYRAETSSKEITEQNTAIHDPTQTMPYKPDPHENDLITLPFMAMSTPDGERIVRQC
jgi:hypothetical protein